MKSDTAHQKLKQLNGWSSSLESALKRTHKETFSNPSSNGTFKIKKIKERFFWYYQLSGSGKGRSKYLCSTEPRDLSKKSSSFEYAFDVLKIKLDTQFKIKSKDSHLLHPFITEYISRNAKSGGYHFDVESFKLVKDVDLKNIKINSTTLKNRLIHIKSFYLYVKERDIPVSIIPSKGLTTLIRDYVENLRDVGKKKRYLNESKGEVIRRATIKNYLRSVRFFMDWMVSEDFGFGLFESHKFTLDFQIKLISELWGDWIPPQDKNDMILFRQEDYKKCINDCVEIVREKWISICKSGGDKEVLRRGYNERTSVEGIKGRFHTNQPADNPIGIDIVYFVSLLQLRYGFRISEILKSFRSEEDMNKFGTPVEMRSYFSKDSHNTDVYLLYILNSKNRNRIVPIDETIWSFHEKPPMHNGKQLGKKIEFKTKDGKKDFRWETNIIDVCMFLFPQSAYLFTSPNFNSKPNQPYQTNYYIGLFKNRMVEEEKTIIRNRKSGVYKEKFDGLGWKNRLITSTHHLRKYFISYMIRQDGVQPQELAEICGHTIQTMLEHYKRMDVDMGRKTLKTNRIQSILSKDNLNL